MKILSKNPINWNSRLNNGLLLWWKTLPGLVGSYIFYDLCGKYHGISTGFPNWNRINRRGGFYSISCDGSDDIIRSDISPLDSNLEATISCWVYREASSTEQSFGVGVNAFSGARFNVLWFSDNKIYFTIDGFFPIYNPGDVTGWYHIVHTYKSDDSIRQRAYINGEEVSLSGTQAGAGGLNTQANLGGAVLGFETDNGFSTGSYDDFRVYNRALSSSEVYQLYIASQIRYKSELNYINGSYNILPIIYEPYINSLVHLTLKNAENNRFLSLRT